MADKFNPPIIDDVLEELEEVEVVRKPPKKEPVIEDTLIIDEATPPPTKRYDIKRNGKELVKTDTDYVYRYLDGSGFAYRLYHKETKTDTFVMYDPDTKGQTDKNGKKIKPRPFRMKNQAVAHMLRELERLNKDDAYKNRDVTFGMVWQMFLDSSHNRAPETIRRYSAIYTYHIEAVFGNRPINAIPTSDYNEFFVEMYLGEDATKKDDKSKKKKDKKIIQRNGKEYKKKDDYSFAYVESVLKFIFLVVRHGYLKHIVSSENYVRFKEELQMPDKKKAKDKKEIRVLTDEQIKQIKELLEPTDYYLPFLISLLGGLRPAENFCLCFDDFDFDNNTVTIDKQMVEEASGRRVIKQPKTDASTRTIELPIIVMLEVKKRKKALDEAREKDPLIFEQNKGKFIDGRNLKEEIIEQPDFINVDSRGRYITAHSFSYYTKIIKRDICPNESKVEDFSFYTFRKTHLSQMAGNNCPIGELMKRAGHVKIETLYDYYYNRSSQSKSALDNALSQVARIVR